MTESQRSAPAAVFRRRADARVRYYRGKLLIAVEDRALELNEVGASIFKWLDGVVSIHDIGVRLVEEYGITEEEAISDSRDFLGQLEEFGAVEAVS